MSRRVGEASRRGIDNTLANWPLILIRIAENVLMLLLVLGTLFGAFMPVVLGSVGMATLSEFSERPDAVIESVAQGMLGLSPLLIVYIIAVITLAMLVGVLVHAFVQGGVVGCYLAGERRAPEASSRPDFRVFTPELWWAEAKRNAWRFFWIYNIIWGIWGLVVLVPLLPVFLLIVFLPENGGAIVLGCFALLFVILVALVVGFAAFVWSQVALVECARTGAGVIESLRLGRGAFRGRGGTILLVAVIYFGVAMAVGSVVAGFTISLDMASTVPGLDIAFLPMRILLSLVNSAVGALVGSWLLAALAAVLVPRPSAADAAVV